MNDPTQLTTSNSKRETENSKQNLGRREKILLYAPLFIWIGVIFFLSSGQGSSTRTSLIIRPLLEFLFPAASSETIAFYHGVIRKLAHFTEYGVLGFLACRAFAGSSANFLRRHCYIASMILVLSVAGLDEFNQSFNPERTGSPVDAMIDLGGGVSAAILFYLTRRKQRH
ncbi:MAG TPA: VanZ family protein [Pyrinomonadaceae bacterium]|nr:VanZ family protein [Pyrinomonadaceae bacterium]